MDKEFSVVRFITALVTLVAFLATLVFAVIGFVEAQYGLGIVCTILSFGLGVFVWGDYNKYIRKE